MLALQDLEFQPGKASPERDEEILALRSRIPQRLLIFYDCLVVSGKKGVAIVCNGVCGECHQAVAARVLSALECGHPIQICIHCRRYLYLPRDESIHAPPVAPHPRLANRQKGLFAHV